MKISVEEVGPFAMNAMIVYDPASMRGFLLDPGDEVPYLLNRVQELGVKVEAIVFTHGHLDHVAHAEDARQALKVPTYLHKDDWMLAAQAQQQAMMFGLPPGPVPKIEHALPGEGTFSVAGLTFEVHHSPGHSPGSVVLVHHPSKTAIVGDVVFAGSVGRTDLPGCSQARLVDSIERVILPLPDDYVLYPGHGPRTTVGQERRSNPFLRGLTSRT
jgi:glyoxylase-like metal-dependent hydrolase (beta-lactamase superfamily II)